jgi:hypothetical protein
MCVRGKQTRPPAPGLRAAALKADGATHPAAIARDGWIDGAAFPPCVRAGAVVRAWPRSQREARGRRYRLHAKARCVRILPAAEAAARVVRRQPHASIDWVNANLVRFAHPVAAGEGPGVGRDIGGRGVAGEVDAMIRDRVARPQRVARVVIGRSRGGCGAAAGGEQEERGRRDGGKPHARAQDLPHVPREPCERRLEGGSVSCRGRSWRSVSPRPED